MWPLIRFTRRRLNRFFGGLCRQQVTRQAEELRAQEERLKQAAAARDKEAAELERQLAEARRAAAEADKRREEILKESYAQQQPAKELAAEADRYIYHSLYLLFTSLYHTKTHRLMCNT